ncbi:hypothetical protein U9M48_010099 [Paspalum notatum var. saurae]|uniref:F-box domain-containing protein n=1 Tax=Paspalum notatum var. saurae TaxID=547442 RepID=A0AAQ3WFX0_PASNO
MEEEKTGMLTLLPDDVLADALGRLQPRSLAACRCVCSAGRAVVDDRRLLRADLLPHSLGGIFINFQSHRLSEFFSAAGSEGAPVSISGKHDYLPKGNRRSWGYVRDHCNGLLLVVDGYYDVHHVLNPATRWVALLPRRPTPPSPVEMDTYYQDEYLVYDPATSPDYEVVSVTRFRCGPEREPGDYDTSEDALSSLAEMIKQPEWPPSVCILPVFSSRTGQWEERSFARQGEALRTIDDMMEHGGWPDDQQHNAVYWQGVLYIHCQTDFVMRVSLSSDKYHVIKPPAGIEMECYPIPQIYLGKSAEGMCCASIKERCRVRVWSLNESGRDVAEWVLKHDVDLSKWLLKHELEYTRPASRYYRPNVKGPWNFQDINDYYYRYKNNCHHKDDGVSMDEPTEQEVEECCSEASSVDDEKLTWSSDDEDRRCYDGYMDILGFHPYKEIIFLGESLARGLAYHWNSSKVQVLGNIFPARYEEELPNERSIIFSFPYTPCMLAMGQTAGDNS